VSIAPETCLPTLPALQENAAALIPELVSAAS
jgi:hypothetical protein